MSLQSYFTNPLTTASQLVILTAKVSVNLATGVVTVIDGKRVTVTAGVGTGVITLNMPQVFKNLIGVYDVVTDPGLVGADFIPTTDYTVTGTSGIPASYKSYVQGTMTKQASGAPVPITTGTFIIGFTVIASA